MHRINFFSFFSKKCVDVQNFLCINTNHRTDVGANGRAGWQNGSCRGLQILLYRFDSGTGLHVFRLSSAVEQSAVNRSVICSNQIAGAKKIPPRKTWGSSYAAISLYHWRPLNGALLNCQTQNVTTYP